MDDGRARHGVRAARVLDAALVAMIAGALGVVGMQARNGDWFPPEVSISQYGVGEQGWMLTTTLLLLAVASVLLLWGARRSGTARRWPVVLPWTVWILGLVVMALVPTNEWPQPLTLSGQVHQGAAVLALFAGPIGAVLMVGPAAREAGNLVRRWAATIVIGSASLSWLFLGLLLLTNIDIDVTGLGYLQAWSLHQTIAVVLDIVMVFALIIFHRASLERDRQRAGMSASGSVTA